jgi:hypothetical protein
MNLVIVASYLAVAFAAFIAGGITCIAFATWLEDNVETPLKKREAQREELAASSGGNIVKHW